MALGGTGLDARIALAALQLAPGAALVDGAQHRQHIVARTHDLAFTLAARVRQAGRHKVADRAAPWRERFLVVARVRHARLVEADLAGRLALCHLRCLAPAAGAGVSYGMCRQRSHATLAQLSDRTAVLLHGQAQYTEARPRCYNGLLHLLQWSSPGRFSLLPRTRFVVLESPLAARQQTAGCGRCAAANLTPAVRTTGISTACPSHSLEHSKIV